MKLLLVLSAIFIMSCSQSTGSQAVSQTNPPAEQQQSYSNVQITDTFSIDYVMGKYDPATHPDFITIETKHASDAGMRLRKDAYGAFLKMSEAAKKDGIDLKILSATRPFSHQKRIWEAKWNGARKVDGMDLSKEIKEPKDRALKILTYSSMPGTSRHHWGTEIDLNSLEPDFFESGEGAKIYDWLAANGPKFGYCQPYSPKGTDRPEGYNEEKWHWSYQPISLQLTNLAKRQMKNELINGFEGSETASKIDVVTKYILGINDECKH